MPTPEQKLNRIRLLQTKAKFLIKEFSLGIVPEADETRDDYAIKNLTMQINRLERLNNYENSLRRNYNLN